VGSEYPIRTFVESVRAYGPGEVEESLEAVGLRVVERFGSFAGDPFHDGSPRLILLARAS
jgi:hypothetical protein